MYFHCPFLIKKNLWNCQIKSVHLYSRNFYIQYSFLCSKLQGRRQHVWLLGVFKVIFNIFSTQTPYYRAEILPKLVLNIFLLILVYHQWPFSNFSLKINSVLTVPNLKTASWYLYINQTNGAGSTYSSLLGINCICIFCR